jgi:hypothetical protein
MSTSDLAPAGADSVAAFPLKKSKRWENSALVFWSVRW